MAQEMEMQNNLMALEMKKMELQQVLTESQQLAGIAAPVTVTPNLNNLLPVNAGASTPLSATLGANAQMNSSLGAAQSSTGLRRALTASVSSGSTLNSRRSINRDLTNLINSTVPDASLADTGVAHRARSVSQSRSLASHHRR
jgi:hypothetical protein